MKNTMETWNIRKEVKQKQTTKGNTYTQERFIVEHDKGFEVFTSFEAAEEYVNNNF